MKHRFEVAAIAAAAASIAAVLLASPASADAKTDYKTAVQKNIVIPGTPAIPAGPGTPAMPAVPDSNFVLSDADGQLIDKIFGGPTPAVAFDGKEITWINKPKSFRRFRKQRVVALFPSTFTCTLTAANISYSPSSPVSPPSVGGKGSVSMMSTPIVFTPTGDDSQIDVAFYQMVSGAALKTPADADSLVVPVNIDIFDAPTVTFTAGIIASNLHDDSYVLTPSGSSSVIKKGLTASDDVKGIAMTHLIVLKRGDYMMGPSLGILSNGGYFLGGSVLGGKSSRLAISLGWEWSKVSRLDSAVYKLGDTVPNGTNINQSIFRPSRIEIALSYSFITLK